MFFCCNLDKTMTLITFLRRNYLFVYLLFSILQSVSLYRIIKRSIANNRCATNFPYLEVDISFASIVITPLISFIVQQFTWDLFAFISNYCWDGDIKLLSHCMFAIMSLTNFSISQNCYLATHDKSTISIIIIHTKINYLQQL